MSITVVVEIEEGDAAKRGRLRKLFGQACAFRIRIGYNDSRNSAAMAERHDSDPAQCAMQQLLKVMEE